MSFLSLFVYKYNHKSKKHLNNYSRKRPPMASSNTRNFHKMHLKKRELILQFPLPRIFLFFECSVSY